MKTKPKTKMIEVNEGGARLLVPEQSFKDPFHLEVFYNPEMSFNRSVSSLALHASLPLLDGAVIVDGLCSLGARGVRYLVENKKAKKCFFVDANPDAVKHLRKNISLNKLQKRSKVAENDLNKFFVNSKDFFDFVEIDPFGSPVFFLENALRKARKKAVLSLTATDLANLCGARPLPCRKHYDAMPLNNEYCHETALRILIGSVARTAAKFDFSITPLFSFYQRHFVKAVLLVEKGAEKADSMLKRIGFVSHCGNCLNREVSELQIQTCSSCSSKMQHAGPLWTSRLGEDSFIAEMRKENEKRNYSDKEKIAELLSVIASENSLPATFYDLHVLAKKRKTTIKSISNVLGSLKEKGFSASRTHFSPTGIKTDASITELAKSL